MISRTCTRDSAIHFKKFSNYNDLKASTNLKLHGKQVTELARKSLYPWALSVNIAVSIRPVLVVIVPAASRDTGEAGGKDRLDRKSKKLNTAKLLSRREYSMQSSFSDSTLEPRSQNKPFESATGALSTSSLGIPKPPAWEKPSFPTTPRELLDTLSSKSFRNSFSTPQSALMIGYSAFRTAFFISQGLYTANRINYRTENGMFQNGVSLDPSSLVKLAEGYANTTLPNIVELHRRDAENVRNGYYKAPYDMDPRHRQWDPRFVAKEAQTFMEFAKDVFERRLRQGRREVLETSEEAKRNREKYPDYYLQNFHFQDGWLSEHSSNSYEVGSETLFLGTQDAMQRNSLVPLHFFMKGRNERKTSLLELACGTGRFLTFIKDNYPHLNTVAVDLSPFFLEKAKQNMEYFTEFDQLVNGNRRLSPTEYIQASAESVPLADESFHVISCVYLFHELPLEASKNVIKEMARLLKPGGIVILNDSVQVDDYPGFDFSRFPTNYHEPYYETYVKTDWTKLFAAEGFSLESSSVLHMSKMHCFKKS